MKYGKLIRNFILSVLALLIICATIVYVADPFFHYHEPYFGLKKVLTEKEYQCIGSVRNFEYDSMIVGSSVCENYNNRWFDDAFGVKSIKAIRSYGATADLCYFIDEAYKNHDLKYVFYNIDPGALAGDTQLTFEQTGCPMYLYDNNPINDIEYLLNKDVLLQRVPYMVSKSFMDEYDEGESYNWGQWKEFKKDMVLGLYIRRKSIDTMKAADAYCAECDGNIKLIEDIVKEHPETQFYIFIPPYSFVWWDNIYRYGDTDAYMENMKKCASALLQYDNVRFYYFLNDEEVVTNLDNYMDVLHFSPAINESIVNKLYDGRFEITKENLDEVFEDSYKFADKAVNELIKPYEDVILVDTQE